MGRIKIDELDGKGYTKAKKDKRYDCWFCDDTNKHLYVSIILLVYHCFKCGASGRIIDKVDVANFNSKILKVTLDKYNRNMADRLKQESKLYEKIIKTLPRNCSSLDDAAMVYLYKRGLTKREIANNDIRQSLDKSGIYSNCVIFPVKTYGFAGFSFTDTEEEYCTYFVARKYDGTEPKYVNAPWPKEGVLYIPVPRKYISPTYVTVICEGIFDAFAINRLGVTDTYALLGKEASTEQIQRIASITPNDRPIVIALDADAFGYAVKLKMMLSELVKNPGRIRVAVLPKGMDPDSMGSRLLREEIDRCVSLALLSKL